MLDRAANDIAREQMTALTKKLSVLSIRSPIQRITPFRRRPLPPSKKKHGRFRQGGSRPIQGVIKVAQSPPHPGLWIMDSVPDESLHGFWLHQSQRHEGIMTSSPAARKSSSSSPDGVASSVHPSRR